MAEHPNDAARAAVVDEPEAPVALSVVIPTYNRATRLQACLASVTQAGLDGVEVVVVDDGSTDDTEAVVARFGREVRYYSQRNAGPAAARNLGIREARGRDIAFLDSDDRLLPGTHARLVECLDRHPDVGVVFADVMVNRPDGSYERAFRRSYMSTFWSLPHAIASDGARLFEPDAFFRHILLDRCYVVMGAVVVRRSALDAAGVFDERRKGYEEWDLFTRLASRFPFAYVDEPAAVIEKHESNFSADEGAMVLQGIEILEEYLRGGLPLSPELRQAATAKLNRMTFDAAYHAFVREDYPTARRRLREYMKRWGVRRDALTLWGATWLPPEQVRRLRGLRARLASSRQPGR